MQALKSCYGFVGCLIGRMAQSPKITAKVGLAHVSTKSSKKITVMDWPEDEESRFPILDRKTTMDLLGMEYDENVKAKS